MKRFVQVGIVWSLIWIALLGGAYLASEGEPVCDGPLILSVDDSDPPQCDDPSSALPSIGLGLFAIGFFPAMLLAAAMQARDSRSAHPA